MNFSKSWQERYLETSQKYDKDLINHLRESQLKKLSLVSPENKIIFQQLFDIEIAFAEYLKSVSSFALSLVNFIADIEKEMGDPKLNKAVLEIKPLMESARNNMQNKSKTAQFCIQEFSNNVFLYIEKE